MTRTPYQFIFLLVCIFNTDLSFAEYAIVPFEEKMALNISGKYNMGIFQQQAADYRTDKPWDIGLGIRYKSLAAQLFIPTSLNDGSFDMAVNFYFEKMYYETPGFNWQVQHHRIWQKPQMGFCKLNTSSVLN
jgi:hypothetical protein